MSDKTVTTPSDDDDEFDRWNWSERHLADSIHDNRTIKQLVWLSEQIRHHKGKPEHTEMLASIRKELCRLDEIQQRLFKAQDAINEIENAANLIINKIRGYWAP